MKIKVQLAWTDYLNAHLLNSRPSRLERVIEYGAYIVLGGGALWGLVLTITGAITMPVSMFVVLFLLIAGYLIYRHAWLPWKARQIFDQQKSLHSPFELEFGEQGLSLTTIFGHSTIPWTTFIRWKEDAELFMLYHSDLTFNILPKRAFTDPAQVEALRAYLVQNHIPTRRPRSTVEIIFYVVFVIVVGAACYIASGGLFLP